MGTHNPPEVPMELHRQNRSKLVNAMRRHLQSEGLPVNGVVLLQGGEEQTRYCTDHAILFRYVYRLHYTYFERKEELIIDLKFNDG